MDLVPESSDPGAPALPSLSPRLTRDPEGIRLGALATGCPRTLSRTINSWGSSPPSSGCLFIWLGFGIWQEEPVY